MRLPTTLRASLLLTALGAALAARANQIVQNFSVDSRTGAQTILLDAFDPSLGTLDSVTIALDVENAGSATVLNRGADTPNAELFTYNLGEIDLYRPTADGNDDIAGARGIGFDDQYTGDDALPRGGSLTASLDYAGGVNGDYAYDRDGNYYNTGTGVFTGRALEGFVARSAGEKLNADLSDGGLAYVYTLSHYTLTRHFQGAMDGSLIYDYAPLHSNAVPEPAPLAVLGLGALAFLRRRRA